MRLREHALAQFAGEEAGGIDRPRQFQLPRPDRFEAEPRIIPGITDEQDEGLLAGAGLLQSMAHERAANPAIHEGGVDRQGAEHECRLLTGPDRTEAHRSDEQRSHMGGERERQIVIAAFAQTKRCAREAPGAEGALVQTLDRGMVGRMFGADGQ